MNLDAADLIEAVEGSSESPAVIAEAILSDANRILIVARASKARIATEVLDDWGTELDRLEILIEFDKQLISHFFQTHTAGGVVEDLRLAALVQLAMRSGLCAEEILSLLKTGFPNGALTRWRTLYELMIAASFLGTTGSKEAEAWLAHDAMMSRGHVRAMGHLTRAEGAPPVFSKEEAEEFDVMDRELLAQYGREFRGQFGFAHAALIEKNRRYRRAHEQGKRNGGPTVLDMTNALDLGDVHALYRYASYVSHGGEAAVDVDEGLREVLDGPTAAGITFAMPLIASSIATVAHSLVMYKGNPPPPPYGRAVRVSIELRDRAIG